MLKIGVIGAGHLGKIHIKLIQQIADWQLVGFFDTNTETAKTVSQTLNVKSFNKVEDLLAAVDTIDIVCPTQQHYHYAELAMQEGKHVFIEKPACSSAKQVSQLMALKKNGLKVQIGHVERFNPAFLALDGQSLNPMFIEGHRLSTFNPRGTDVSVVLDLMIHDLDIVVHLLNSSVKDVQAAGVKVISDTSDIANARILFENGCVANLTASRISLKKMRKMRLFQPSAYIGIDFLDKKTQIFELNKSNEAQASGLPPNGIPFELNGKQAYLHMQQPNVPDVNAIKMELECFASAIKNDTAVKVSLNDSLRVMELAERIMAEIENNLAQQPELSNWMN